MARERSFIMSLLFLLLTSATASDFSWVRGANYIPSTAQWDFFTDDPQCCDGAGFVWDPLLVARELSYARTVLNLNALRVRASPASYARDPAAFAANMGTFLSLEPGFSSCHGLV